MNLLPTPRRITSPLTSPRQIIESWATSSQLKARRNALVASTTLAQRRAELVEVDLYLRQLTGTRQKQARVAGA